MKKSDTILFPGVLLITGLFFLSQGAMAQSSVTGTITDASDGQPLPGVNIIVRGTDIGTASDIDGMYELRVPSLSDTLVFTFIGYQTREVPINGRTTIDIALQAQAILGEEVVVVGYGTQTKETVTGSIVSVTGRELTRAPVANVSNALVGRMSGITALQLSGEPGRNEAEIRIRGVSTLNGSGREPLIIIDGIQSSFSVLNALDVNTIESISVLKDASSTAVYGVRGANGVILVKTKRGQAGRPQISFSSNYGITQMTFPLEMLSSYEYAKFRNESIQMSGDPNFNDLLFSEDELWKFRNNRDYTPEEVEAMDLTPEQEAALMASPALYYTSHDWFDEQFGHPGPQQQYNLNLSGGGDNVRYFTSVGYFSQEGNIDNGTYGRENTSANSHYDRYNFRSNFDIDVAENVEVSVNIAGQISEFGGILGKDGDITGQFSRNKEMTVLILQSSPFEGPGIVDGHLVTNFVDDTSPLAEKGGGGFSPTAYVLGADVVESRTSRLQSNLEIRHTMDYLTQGLYFQGTVAYDNRYRNGRRIFPSIPTYTAMRNPDNPAEILFFGGETGPADIEADYNSSKWRRFYLEGGINYNRAFGNHVVTGLALVNAQKTFDPGLRFNVPAGLMGLVGRVTYNYDERYLVEFNMGYNGSENFPEGNRFGFFPAYSAGWIISNENFFPENDWVTWLKVRGSYGEVGNDQVGGSRYLYLPSTWDFGDDDPTGGYYFGDSNGSSQDPYYIGASEDDVGNPDVTWERAKKYNIGFEARFFNDRLSFTGDYFQENRDNILWNLGTIPALVGADLPPANIGEVSNHGYELEVGWADQMGQVAYRLNGSISYARNKIEFMAEPPFPYPWMNETGFSLGQYRGYRNSGFYNNAAQANNRPYSTVDGNRVQAGDLRYIDINGDGILDLSDQVPMGYSNLPQYAFKWSLQFNYKGFGLYALFTGTANGSLPMANFEAIGDSPLVNPFSRGSSGAWKFQYEGHWTPEKVEQGITPTFPRAAMAMASTQNVLPSNFWLLSGDHVRLKTVQIGYTFGVDALDWVNMQSIRVYINGNNLYTFGDHLIDPSQAEAGAVTRGYFYPITRIYNFGVEFQF